MALTTSKRELLVNFMDQMKETALKAADRMPEDWDGHEIRAYLAEKFAFEVSCVMRDKRSRRVREFRNTMAVNNL